MNAAPRRAPTALLLPITLLLSLHARPAEAQRGGAYFPGPGAAWERREPERVGMDAARLREAAEFHRAHEATAPRDLEAAHHQSFGREPFGEPVGPFRERGDPAGIVVRHGYVVAEWGDPERVDMTFSVTKSFLSTVVGVAFDRGMIRLDEPVWRSQAPVLALPERQGRPTLLAPFDTPHNRTITWEHLLRQTSDWEGTLWGKPEWADRPAQDPSTWRTRARVPAGQAYEYNDVRVNALALAALNVWRRPLPEVLREEVMDPIGASPTWRWLGYETSWVEMDGRAVQSVSGGGHWGGGMFISARDQARFGLLTLRRGRWNGRQIVSEEWIRRATTPTPAQTDYGFMNYFLNTDRKRLPSAPASAWVHLGNGTNAIYVDPENDLVVVVRWIQNDALDGVIQRVLASITDRRR
jgi:CubicO group peptidase (beta-lactamase class C family)